ncbi:uncharacterized protein EI90DRAFT_2359223 [Cantharellus anzutake]|uniref:uncharacterized protein n=1 Tax=Cantharellus anzutake TaxID=1750568 RepID=UPI001902D0BD|nr:uncharacterized protein EI90DRAFT_2359223 [Cantharellus anzutake]KAF8324341.1 hypothetical protein EI90DRAFT_2359223 [Cantharellus anzutake]
MQSLEEYDTGITTDVTGTESLVDDEDITYTKDATRPKRVSRKPSSIRKGSTVNAVDMDAASDTSVVNESTPLASRSNKIVGGQTIPAPQLSRPTPRTRSVSSSSLAQPGAGGTVTVEIDVLDHISRVMEAVHPAKPKRPIVALPKRTSQQPSPLSQPQPATRTPHQQNPTPTSPAKPPKSPPTSTGHYDPSLVIPRVKSKSSGSRIDTGTVAEFSSKLESNDSQAGTESHTETQIQDSSLIGRGAHSPTPRKGNPHHSDGHPPNAEPTVEVQTQDVSEPQSTTLVHPSSSFSSDGFTEEQLDMTIQQFIEAETQRVYQNMKRSGEQLIEELVEEGKRQRAIIVAHLNASSIPE